MGDGREEREKHCEQEEREDCEDRDRPGAFSSEQLEPEAEPKRSRAQEPHYKTATCQIAFHGDDVFRSAGVCSVSERSRTARRLLVRIWTWLPARWLSSL